MLTFAKQYGFNINSQNGEDGILEECIKRIKPEVKTCVEFGGADGYFCSNTRLLIDNGWDGRMYDPNALGDTIPLTITVNNINNVVGNPTVLSIDVDNDDYHLWKAYKGTPDIVIIEINSSIPPDLNMTPGTRGTSYKSMVELGHEKGYFLLCHCGNLVFILNKHLKLFMDIYFDPIEHSDIYFNRSWL
jgi:hypothetical protein